jgi:hypothetical protein
VGGLGHLDVPRMASPEYPRMVAVVDDGRKDASEESDPHATPGASRDRFDGDGDGVGGGEGGERMFDVDMSGRFEEEAAGVVERAGDAQGDRLSMAS